MKTFLLTLVGFALASQVQALPTVEVRSGSSVIRPIVPHFERYDGGIFYYSIEYDRIVESNYASITLVVRGSATDGIQTLQVLGWSGGGTLIDVAGPDGGRIGPVETITKMNASGLVSLSNLRVGADVGLGSGTTGNVISVDFIQSMDVLGNVYGGISANTSRIDSLIVSGNVEGPINGALEARVINIGGSLGTPSNPQSLQFGDVLRSLTAGAIYGDIYSTRSGAGIFPTVWRIETTSGPFVGALTCKKLLTVGSNPAGIVISGGPTPSAGVLDADIIIDTQASEVISATGGIAAGSTIKIAGAYTRPITIAPTGGLHGQLIINAGNTTGTWTGDLTVGSTTVTGPYYTATNLGEGAVGLVPFHVQAAECYPPANATIVTPLPSATLYYTFYGPVKAANAEIVPIVISRTPIYFGENIWTDVTTSFAVATPGNGSRSVEITAGTGWLEAGYKYKIEPHPTTAITLLCDRLLSGTANTPVVGSGYSFSVIGPVVEGCESGCE